MVNSQLEKQGFVQTLLKLRLFWYGLLGLIIGLGFSAWFFLRVLNAPVAVVFIGMLWATLVGMSVIVYTCYQFYSGKFVAPRDAVEARSNVLKEVIVATPLMLGGIAIFYFLVIDRLSYITPAVVASFVLWLLLRLLLRKKKSRATSPIRRLRSRGKNSP